MKRHDISTISACTVRECGAFVARLALRVAMLSNPGAIIRTLGISE